MNKNKKNLLEIHNLFLESIKDFVEGEFLVGSLAYVEERFIRKDSDLDIICVVDKKKLKYFLETKYLNNTLLFEDANKILKRKLADYLVLKTKIKEILLSIDVISPEFFKKMCVVNLRNANKTYDSYKYGNLPQTNRYDAYNISRKKIMVEKESKKIIGGYTIKLPLFTIFQGKYFDGIPTIKFLTNQIYFDPKRIISKNISTLYSQIIRRLLSEKKASSNAEIYNLLINLIKKKDKLSSEYVEKIKKEIELNSPWKKELN